MFVRVIKNDLEGKSRTSDELFDCQSALVESVIATEAGDPVEELIRVKLDERSKDAITLELTKKDHEIYFMNNNGKTIDSYTW